MPECALVVVIYNDKSSGPYMFRFETFPRLLLYNLLSVNMIKSAVISALFGESKFEMEVVCLFYLL